MSGTVDDEVVRMRFDNNAFERGVAATLGTLSKLKSALSFTGATKGLDQVEARASKLDMSGANKQIDESAHHWSLWQTAGYIAFATIVHRATNAAINVAKAFTVNPIGAGFQNYETQINAVQTILANTGLKGAAGLAQVNKTLNELNTYANQTVYNFSEMTKNIGTFTAAGVALAPATNAIKGIANLAALSGSSSEQASTAMYQLSQAIAANKVGLQDWNSVVNAGLGGKVFQQALFNTGKLQGTLKGVKANETFDQWTKAGNSFRNSLQSGWITGKVLTDTLSQFTGDLTDAQLKSMGYNAAQIKQIQELAKTAKGAATNIKTLTQLRDALKEEVATAYGAIFKTIFGDINQATKLFSALHTHIENALTGPINHLNELLQTAAKFGGRTSAISAFVNIFRIMGEVIKPIKDAFHEIFPPATGEQLAKFLNMFDDLVSQIKVGSTTALQIKRIFAGVFALFSIGWQIIKAVGEVFGSLFNDLSKNTGGVLAFLANIGDLIVAFNEAAKNTDLFGFAAQIVINLIHTAESIFATFTAAVKELFKNLHPFAGAFDHVSGSVDHTGKSLARAAIATQVMSDWFAKLPGKIKPGVDAVVRAFQRIGEFIASGFNSQTFSNILKTIQTGLLVGIVVLLKKFLSNGLSVDLGGGFLEKLGGMFEGVTGNLKAMQQQLKAKALLEIAIAMGVLAASLVVLSMINPEKLAAALKAMAIGFGELLGAMAILTKISGSAGFVKIPIIAASLDLLAGAILILTLAVYALSRLSWQELEKGLTAVGVLLAAVSLAAIPLSANSAGMVRAGIGITAMAVAINVLYVAVKLFSMMSWSAMLKGMAGVGILLVGIAIAMRLMPRNMTLQAAALVLIAAAVNALYFAVKDFASLDWKTMLRGLAGVAGALTAVAIAMQLMPPNMVLQSIGLIAIGVALQLIYKAVADMSKLSWKEMGKGLAVLASSLIILAGAMYLMSGSLAGAAALLIVAAALRIFIPSLVALQAMSWGKIVKGLGALALSFATIGIAGLLLTSAIPGMLALGVALGLVGVAMLAFGAGAALLGIGLTAIAAAGGTAIGVLISGLKSLIELLPTLGNNLAVALVSFITIIGKNAPAIVGAFVSILTQLLQAVPKIMPSLIVAVNSLVKTILTILITNAPSIIAAGFQLLMDLLTGIKNNIGQIVTTVALIIVNFLNALAANIGPIVKAGVNLLFKFLEGVASAAGQVPAEVIKLIGIFLGALFASFPKIADAGVKLIGKLAGGITGSLGTMASAAASAMAKFLNTAFAWFVDMNRLGYNILKKIAEGIANGISTVVDKAIEIGKEIVNGIVKGVESVGHKVGDAIITVGTGGLNKLAGKLGMGGPSKLFADNIGVHIPGGIALGIEQNAGVVTDSLLNLSRDAIASLRKTMAGLHDAISAGGIDYYPKITPILDLSQVQKDASQISGLVAVNPIVPVVSSNQASEISVARSQSAYDEVASNGQIPSGPTIKIEQNNTSPKALSTVDIYRHTKNALALAKKELGIVEDLGIVTSV